MTSGKPFLASNQKMKRFRTCSLDQDLLLPVSLQQWLPEGHLARFIAGVMESLDLSKIFGQYGRKDGRGQAAYHPTMMVRVLLYGYATGVRSSRKIERATYEDVAFRYLAADQHPDHDVIAEFRKNHLAALSEIFLQMLHLCQRAELVKVGQIAIDGTKVQANASRRQSQKYGQLSEEEKRLADEVHRRLAEAEATDQREDEEFGLGRRGDEWPKGLVTLEQRLAKIRAAKQELEREARQKAEQAAREKAEQQGKPHDEAQKKRWQRSQAGVPAEKTQGNLTDPESRLMVDGSSKAYVQGYNAQVAAAGVPQIIVAQTVTQESNDRQQLCPMLQQTEHNVGGKVDSTLADAGYWNESVLARLQAEQRDVLVPPDGGKPDPTGKLAANAPQGPMAQQMRQRLAQPQERQRYRKRSGIVEPVFGMLKEILGYRRFLLRGLQKVRGEWALMCTAFNLRKLFLYGSSPEGRSQPA
jgi:transposase